MRFTVGSPAPFGGKKSRFSTTYSIEATINCFSLLMQAMPVAFWRALASAGKSMPAKIAMMAMTTSSSINVKPADCCERGGIILTILLGDFH